MAKNRTADVASILIPIILLAGLGTQYAAPPGLTIDENPFKAYDQGTGWCVSDSGTNCNSYDFLASGSGGDCQGTGSDTDGDGYSPWVFGVNQELPDPSCLTLQDWDQDGTCDHRVYDGTRNQADVDYQPSDLWYALVGGNYVQQPPSGGVCNSWSPA